MLFLWSIFAFINVFLIILFRLNQIVLEHISLIFLKKMRRRVKELVAIVILLFCVQQTECYAQESDLSIMVRPSKSKVLTDEAIQRQAQLELDEIMQLSEKERQALYEELPDRSLGEVQSRTMTYETQKTCKAVEREYKIDIRHLSSAAVNSFWDFGDGKPPKLVAIPYAAGSLATNYIYDIPGVYTIEILFFDSSFGPVSADEKKIKVIVEACTAPEAPQLPVNPNIHKVTVE